jgi:23S rRNA (pseudouridine1915-N3)-methyltransferase
MQLRVIAVGSRMPAWVEQGCREYSKRLPRELRLQWVEVPLGPRNKASSVERAIATEDAAMLARIPADSRVIALDIPGCAWSTEQLANELGDWKMDGRTVCLLIGGPDGLGQFCKDRADKSWSLSPLTLPHPLVRILLAEQLYRAWSLGQGHPYHR